MYFSEMTRAELEKELSGLQKEYDELAKEGLSLDLQLEKSIFGIINKTL